MRRHYLVGCIALLGLSGLIFWTWRYLDPERSSPAGVAGATLAAADCPAVLPSATTAPPELEVRPAPAAKPINSTLSGEPAIPPEFQSIEPRLVKNPEFRKAMHSQQRVVLEDAFRDLPKILGLSADQSARLFDLLAEQQVRKFDMRWQKPEPGQTFVERMQEARARNATELAELLGPSNMIRYQEFRASLEGRAEVNSVRSELARSWEPMRESQYEPLLAVVNVELQRLNQEIDDLGPRGIPGSDPANETRRSELTIEANQRILDAARPILSSAQLTGLADLYRRQRLQMQTQDTLNRLQVETAAGMVQGSTPK